MEVVCDTFEVFSMVSAGEVTNSVAYFPISLDVFVLSHVLG